MAKDYIAVKFYTERIRKDIVERYLESDSDVMDLFKEPLDLFVRNTEDPGGEKCYITMDWFRGKWPDVLKQIIGISSSNTCLIYFSGLFTDVGLLSVTPFLSLEHKNQGRFYIPEICKDIKSRSPVGGHVCLEFYYDDFCALVSPDGFSFFPGTEIMGIIVDEANVKKAIRTNVFDKHALTVLLCDAEAWWVCDSDLGGMTIWHRNISNADMQKSLGRCLLP